MAYRTEEDEEVVDQTDVDVDDYDDDEDGEFEILVEGRDEIPSEEDAGPTADELRAELERLKSEQATATARLSDRETFASGFDKLSALLEKQHAAGQTPTADAETWESLEKRLKKNFYDDPVESMKEMLQYFVRTEVGPAFQNVQNAVGQTALVTSRQMAAQDETNKIVLEKYSKEVEEVVKSLPSGPDVYERACRQVGMNHFTELLSEMATGKSPSPSRPRSNVNPSGPGVGRPTTTSGKKRVVLTSADRAKADSMGMAYDDYVRYVKNG